MSQAFADDVRLKRSDSSSSQKGGWGERPDTGVHDSVAPLRVSSSEDTPTEDIPKDEKPLPRRQRKPPKPKNQHQKPAQQPQQQNRPDNAAGPQQTPQSTDMPRDVDAERTKTLLDVVNNMRTGEDNGDAPARQPKAKANKQPAAKGGAAGSGGARQAEGPAREDNGDESARQPKANKQPVAKSGAAGSGGARQADAPAAATNGSAQVPPKQEQQQREESQEQEPGQPQQPKKRRQRQRQRNKQQQADDEDQPQQQQQQAQPQPHAGQSGPPKQTQTRNLRPITPASSTIPPSSASHSQSAATTHTAPVASPVPFSVPKSVRVEVEVPEPLLEWTKERTSDLNAILANTKEKCGVMAIVLERLPVGGSAAEQQKLVITSEGADEANRAKMMLELHLKNQEQLLRTAKRVHKVQDDITAVQGAVAAGLRIEFTVDEALTGLVIGKKGERINRVYEATGVSKIDVNEGVVRIVGPTNASVLKAREMLELMQVDVPVSVETQAWLSRPMLMDIRVKSECAAVRLEGDSGVRLIGTKKQVENAKLLLETQLEYISKHQELRETEDKMRQKLYTIEASFGGGDRPRGPPRNRRDGETRSNGRGESREGGNTANGRSYLRRDRDGQGRGGDGNRGRDSNRGRDGSRGPTLREAAGMDGGAPVNGGN